MSSWRARLEAFVTPRLGELVILGLCVGVLGLSVVLTPSNEALRLFGVEIPVLCGFRRLTGFGCPGCGLTRSFVFLAHGHLLEAFRMNWLGPPLFLAVVGQIPWRLYRMWIQPPTRVATPGERGAAARARCQDRPSSTKRASRA